MSEGLLTILIGLMLVICFVLAATALQALWTSLVLGSILGRWYEDQYVGSESGVQTGAYALRSSPDGVKRQKPIDPDSDEDEREDADAEIDERLKEKTWHYLYGSR